MNANETAGELERGDEILGARVTIYDVYYYLVGGRSKNEILGILPITSEQFDRATAYIDRNRAEVERIHREIEERNSRGNPPEIRARLEESRRRFEEIRATICAAKSPEAIHAGNSRGC